jgi:hypothetical protein
MQKLNDDNNRETIFCDECREEFTYNQVKKDHVRFYKVGSAKSLCECCYDDFVEKGEE